MKPQEIIIQDFDSETMENSPHSTLIKQKIISPKFSGLLLQRIDKRLTKNRKTNY